MSEQHTSGDLRSTFDVRKKPVACSDPNLSNLDGGGAAGGFRFSENENAFRCE